MYKFMKEHEEYIKSCLHSKDEQDWSSLLDYHRVQTEFMQHERVVHLMVTVVFAVLLLFFFTVAMMFDSAAFAVITAILIVVELFYIVHYYRLENGVQRWYRLNKEIYERMDAKQRFEE